MSDSTIPPGLRGIMFVSINSSVMTPGYFNLVEREANKRCESLIFCLLDEPELINQRYLWSMTQEGAQSNVRAQCAALQSMFAVRKAPTTFLALFRQYAVDPDYIRVFETVTLLYRNSGPFRRHCHSQVFRNLHPVLRKRQITRKSDELVHDLSPYLLQEISLKLFISRRRSAHIEFAPRPEMDLIEAIYQGRYSPLEKLMNDRLPYVVVKPDEVQNDRA